MENDLISIIIPIYNVEKYLNMCIDSVINQTYKKLEIILVDDGSPDKCGKMCDEYAKKDKRIKVIHKKNEGLSDARNKGIDNASGKYITFIDSDDYVEKDYIKLLYEEIKRNNVLISQCGIKKVSENNKVIEEVGYEENLQKSSREMIIDLYRGRWENIVVWNKMYSKALFDNIRFPKGKIHEDEFTTYKILYKVKKIAIVHRYIYNYRQNEESITGKKYNTKRLDILKAIEERISFYKKQNEEELYDLSLEFYLHKIRECYINTKKYISESKKIEDKLVENHKKYSKYLLKSKKVKIKSKFKILIFWISPQLFYKLKER